MTTADNAPLPDLLHIWQGPSASHCGVTGRNYPTAFFSALQLTLSRHPPALFHRESSEIAYSDCACMCTLVPPGGTHDVSVRVFLRCGVTTEGPRRVVVHNVRISLWITLALCHDVLSTRLFVPPSKRRMGDESLTALSERDGNKKRVDCHKRQLRPPRPR